MIRDNLAETVVGHEQKLAAGLTYAQIVGSAALEDDLRALGANELADGPAVELARAISPSPAQIDEAALACASVIPPAGIVELVSFIALLQLLHRLSAFFTTETLSSGV